MSGGIYFPLAKAVAITPRKIMATVTSSAAATGRYARHPAERGFARCVAIGAIVKVASPIARGGTASVPPYASSFSPSPPRFMPFMRMICPTA